MWKIENALVVGVAVDGAHECMRDAEFVIQDFRHWRETIRRATRIRDNFILLGIKEVVVYADANRHVRIFCRRADQYPFRAGFAQVRLGFIAAREKPSRLEDYVDI